jgi:hypothetical protein
MSSLPDAQAIFRRRRHQPRRPPLAKIRPGSPAPAIGPGTASNKKTSLNCETVAGAPLPPASDRDKCVEMVKALLCPSVDIATGDAGVADRLANDGLDELEASICRLIDPSAPSGREDVRFADTVSLPLLAGPKATE